MNFTWKDFIEIILSFIAGGGLAFHFTKKYYVKTINKNKQIQKNGIFSKNNTQIGEINVRK